MAVTPAPEQAPLHSALVAKQSSLPGMLCGQYLPVHACFCSACHHVPHRLGWGGLQKEGKLLPGKKGIMLSGELWGKLRSALGTLSQEAARLS